MGGRRGSPKHGLEKVGERTGAAVRAAALVHDRLHLHLHQTHLRHGNFHISAIHQKEYFGGGAMGGRGAMLVPPLSITACTFTCNTHSSAVTGFWSLRTTLFVLSASFLRHTIQPSCGGALGQNSGRCRTLLMRRVNPLSWHSPVQIVSAVSSVPSKLIPTDKSVFCAGSYLPILSGADILHGHPIFHHFL
jgi:hypothetical protein